MTRFVIACQAVAVRRLVLIFLTLLAFGAIKLPIERDLHAHGRGVSLDLDLREQLGQVGFVAALSGFRSIIADLLFIQANAAWERTEWARVVLFLRQATTLQPRAVLFWDMAAWHMGWNASVAALNDRSQPRLALRIKAQREYLAVAKDFLERGIGNNPERPQLCETLARLYRDKYNDHERASEFFAKAAVLPGAMSYDRRFSAYELSYVEGREREAYERLRQLYDAGENERLPTLIRRLKFLEDKLDISRDQRISDDVR
jgi:tetratricopeptide (TPR) repeat protein